MADLQKCKRVPDKAPLVDLLLPLLHFLLIRFAFSQKLECIGLNYRIKQKESPAAMLAPPGRPAKLSYNTLFRMTPEGGPSGREKIQIPVRGAKRLSVKQNFVWPAGILSNFNGYPEGHPGG